MSRPNLTINPQRLWDDLMETARIGGTPGGGIKRLTLSEEDREVRDWFRKACEALGCGVTVDSMGNMFAHRAGRRPDLPPIAMGSHLDTQPTGGKFDGVLGVLAGLEVLRTLNDAGFETNAPLELINWTNEEGARFQPAMLASGVFAGAIAEGAANDKQDADGVRFGDALDAIGYRGAEPVGQHPHSAYIELHIEQGPILEAEACTIGVVTGVQGVRWYEVIVTGQSAHTGATPMHLRRNALLGAARMVEAVHTVGLAHAPRAVATVGRLDVTPNSPNVVAGSVNFSVDLRHPDDSVLDQMEAAFRASIGPTLEPLGLTFVERRIWMNPATAFDPGLIAAVRAGAEKAGYAWREIVSGAGHDAAYLARVVPSTMIFVPCAGGISHNEAESATLSDCGAGAQVLLETVLAFDAQVV
jgi:beta-ureidopropionase / N-carbamoyl-L-amino-acid hydrolase